MPTKIIKFVDYSSKYGLGYELNNGDYGVYFNDSSKIILDPMKNEFYYYQKDSQNFYTMNNYPKEYNKKVLLLTHFMKYLKDDKKINVNEKIKFEKNKDEFYTYIKKWMRTKNAIFFRLSNKTMQCIFNDKTEIILLHQGIIVYYIDKKSQKYTYLTSKAMESSHT